MRRAAITYLFTLVGVLGPDLIMIAKMLSLSAMISYDVLFGHPIHCVAL